MTIRYRNTAGDAMAFGWHYCTRSLLLIGAGCIGLVLVGVSVCRDMPTDLPFADLVFTVLCYELMTVACVVLWSGVVIVTTEFARANKTFRTEQTMTLTEDGFTTESVYCRAEQKWAIVQRLARTKKHVFIYVGKYAAHVVPRRAFRDDQEWEAFYEFCRRKSQAASSTAL